MIGRALAELLYRLRTPKHRRVVLHDPRPYNPERLVRSGIRL